jgi:serine/threonine protein kinase
MFHFLKKKVLLNTRHPNILRMYGYFHDSKRIFLMLEFAAKGELYKQLVKKGRFTERRSSRVSRLSEFVFVDVFIHAPKVHRSDGRCFTLPAWKACDPS